MRQQLLLRELVGPRRDRSSLLAGHLERCRIPCEWIQTAGSRHLLVHAPRFDESHGTRLVFTAHYDRHPRSPGANDNASAVASLLAWLENAWEHLPSHISVLFTDREEILKNEALDEQGSFGLGAWFRKRSLFQQVFVHFDAFGRGDVPVLSTTTSLLMQEKGFSPLARLGAQKRRGLETLLSDKLENFGVRRLATPLSDDVGFVMQGFGALLLTCLPRAEADAWESRRQWPETWRMLNSPADRPQTLTAQAPDLMEKILDRLTGWRQAASSAA